MGGFMLMGLLAPAFFLLMIAWAISTIVIAVTLPKRAVKVPACERCKYPVAGLAAFNCPECGTDLRVTGIITRTMEVRRRGNLFAAIMAWTVLCAMAGLVATSVFSSMLMMSNLRKSGNSTTLTTTTTFTPTSASFKGIDVVTVLVTPLSSPGTPTTTITATIHTAAGTEFVARSLPGSTPTAAAPSTTWTWRRGDGSDATVPSLDAASILEWYTLAGVEKSPVTDTEASELALSISTLASDPGSTIGSTELFNISAAPPVVTGLGTNMFGADSSYVWTAISLALAGLLAWGVGVWLIVYRRKRMLRAAPA